MIRGISADKHFGHGFAFVVSSLNADQETFAEKSNALLLKAIQLSEANYYFL